MAVAAYASVLSLMRSLDNVLLPSRCWLLPNKSQVETLQQKLGLLQDSLEIHSSSTASSDLLLDDPTITQLREVVYEVDDVIDKYVVDQLRGAESEDDCDKILSSSFCRDVEALIQRIEFINQEFLMMVAKDHGKVVQPRVNSSHGGASRVDSHGKSTMVGFNNHLENIMSQLVGPEPKLQVIPIVGMGGIGKTTLARHTFDNRLIMEHFDVRIWLTISQEYDVQEIFLLLELDGVIDKGDHDLGTRLYQKLCGRRYLIVIDDIWSTEAWDDFKSFFPSNGNRSRIMITTRLSNLAASLGPNNAYSIGLLDEENSWTLLREKSFCNAGLSNELEQIGKKIVKNCGGLPLALVVIGGLLAKSNGDHEYWELVAENMNSFVSSEIDENCLRILSLSYSHLPIRLKPCFLCMIVFPEDSDIYASELIELWVAEGIVKPDRDRNTEDIAKEYLEDLAGRHMIFIRELGNLREIKICGIHDLLRQLCIRESRKEGFMSVPTVQKIIPYLFHGFEKLCFLCCKNGTCKRIKLCQVFVGSRLTTPVTPLVCDECYDRYPRLNESTSVKIIDEIGGQLVEVPQLTKVRFLGIGGHNLFTLRVVYASPSTVWLLWNLQVLYTYQSLLLSKIWEMPQLRHVHLSSGVLPDPVDTNDIVLKHLQTLGRISNLRFTKDLIRRIPNVVDLCLHYAPDSSDLNCSYYCLNNLALLHNIRSLFVECVCFSLDVKSISFPCSLKELALYGGKLLCEDMAIIGSLPNLEVLELINDAFVGDEWSTIEGQFPKLKYLRIASLGLVIWRAESSHLQVLEKLVLLDLYNLEELPLDIGDINTLRTIIVIACNECVVNSAKLIMEEQEFYGNELLCIEIEEDED